MRNLKIFLIILGLILTAIVAHAQNSQPKKSEQFLGSGQEFRYSMNENLQGKILEVTPEYWFYGAVALQAGEATKEFVFKNIGTESFNVTVPSTIGGGFFPSSPGDVLLVEPNNSQNLQFNFDPFGFPGFKFKTVVIENESDNAPHKNVYLSGIGGNMILEVTPYSWDYEIVPENTNSDKVFQLKNISGSTIRVDSLTIEGRSSVFSLQTPPTTPFLLNVNDTQEVTVRFHPTTPDTQIDFLKVNFLRDTDTPDSFMVFLKGIGRGKALTIKPDSLDFGVVDISTSNTLSLIIKNEIEQSTATISSIEILPSDPFFEIIYQPGENRGFFHGDSDSVLIKFEPEVNGPREADLSITYRFSDEDEDIHVTVPLSGIGIGGKPKIEVFPPDTINFLEVFVNSSKTDSVIIKNTGKDTLIVYPFSKENIQSPPGYDTTDFNIIWEDGWRDFLKIAPNDSQRVTVTFAPKDTGNQIANLVITNNDPIKSTVRVLLIGNGIELAPKINVQPDSLDFETVIIDSSKVDYITILNKGNDTLRILPFTKENLVHPSNQDTTDFIFVWKNEWGDILKIDPDSSKKVTITFSPQDTGFQKANLVIESNDPGKQVIRLPIKGIGGKPIIKVDKNQIDFQNVLVDSVSLETLTISNIGYAMLQIDSIKIDSENNDFGYRWLNMEEHDTVKIGRGDSVKVEITFSPQDTGKQKANLVIFSNDRETPAKFVELLGNGIKPNILVNTNTLDFGNIKLGSADTLSLSIMNGGTAELIIYSITPPAETTDFDTTNSPTLPAILAQYKTLQVDVIFAPQKIGPQIGSLIIASNDVTLEIDLKGVGEAAYEGIVQNFINYPNPFGNETTIEYRLSEPSKVSINIYDVSGDLVVELTKNEQKEWQSQGKDNIVWYGTDFKDRKLAYGVYICELIAVAGDGKEERRYRKIAIFEK